MLINNLVGKQNRGPSGPSLEADYYMSYMNQASTFISLIFPLNILNHSPNALTFWANFLGPNRPFPAPSRCL